MQENDRRAFLQRLVVLSELFGKPLSPAAQTLYFEALQDLDLASVLAALNQATKTHTFMPKPAELRSLILGDGETATERAWMALRAAMQSAGAYASLVIADPALAETILAMFGSWPAACAAEFSPEMWTAKRKEFGRVYGVCVGRGLVGTRYLPGICEQQNAGRPEWLAYVPVKQLVGHTIEALSLERADRARSAIAATSHGFTRIAGDLDVEPIDRGDTA